MDADDLVQEICLRALRSYESFDPDLGTFRGWIFGVANHTFQDLLRRMARPGAKLDLRDQGTSAIRALPDAATAVSQQAARAESLVILAALTKNLPESDRQLLLYRGLEGLPLKDVASILGIETETAKKRWQRLSSRLELELFPRDFFEDRPEAKPTPEP
jgi:RNA polymerase sigma-70 factor (ECF subfamily)